MPTRPDDAAHGGGRRNAGKTPSDAHALPPAEQRTFPREPAKADAAGQFVRRTADETPPGLDGLHSANPKVVSGDGDATQPLKPKPKPRR